MRTGNRAAGLAMVGVVGLRAAEASACGGCFLQTPPPGSRSTQTVTDHRMALAIRANETILWDQIRYAGAPDDFSRVLPVSGDVRPELASSEFFDELDGRTASWVTPPPLPECPSGTSITFGGGAGANRTGSDGGRDASGGGRYVDMGQLDPVEVSRTETVGPYSTVLIRSTEPTALTTWLTAHGYVIPASVQPLVDFYVGRQMDFVVMRLRPGADVKAMQPVRVRYAGASNVLPLRMVAAGVADSVGITLWVFGMGRYRAMNFGNGTIDARELEWDWDRNESNYARVFRATQERLDGGRAWITEAAAGTGTLATTAASASSRYDWQLATFAPAGAGWVTRMRSDLPVRFLDTDLSVESSPEQFPVRQQLNARRWAGTPPRPICASQTDVGVAGAVVTCAVRGVGRGGLALGERQV